MSPTLTKQQAAYQYLKDLIMRGKLGPGKRLIIEEIADELGLSIIPVREALQSLQAERLVEIRPHAGATVTAITDRNIEEIFTILEGMESMTVRCVARNLQPEVRRRLETLLGKMDEAERRGDPEAWSSLNMEFHLSMSKATGMPWLHEITSRALANWDRIRRHFFRDGMNHRFTEAQREHHLILKALVKGDEERAEILARRHSQNAFRHYSHLQAAGSLERAA